MRFRSAKRGGRGAFPLFLFLVTVLAVPLGANGAGSDAYDAQSAFELVDRLIEEGRLDDAIEALTVIARTDPEQMGRVQSRILDIREFKDRLNVLYLEAADAVANSDEVAAQEIITRIRTEFPHLNRNDRNRLIAITKLIQKQADEIRMADFFDQAEAYLAVQDYRTAVDTYQLGMTSDVYLDLATYERNLEAASSEGDVGYANDAERRDLVWTAYRDIAPGGEILIDELYDALETWDREAAGLSDITERAMTAIANGEPAGWDAATRNQLDLLSRIVADHTASRDKASEIQEVKLAMDEALQQTPEEYHYNRILQFLNGRTGREGTEGTFYAQEKLWEDSYLSVANRMYEIARDDLEQGRLSYDIGDYDESVRMMDLTAGASASIDLYLAEAEELITLHKAEGITRFTDVIDEIQAFAAYAGAAAPYWTELSELTDGLPDLDGVDWDNFDRPAFEAMADAVQVGVTRAEEMIAEWNAADAALSSLPGSQNPVPAGVSTALRNDLAEAIDTFSARRLAIYLNAIKPLYESREAQSLAAMDVDLDAIREYALGIDDDETLTPVREPSAALESRIIPAMQELEAAIGAIDDFMAVTQSMLDAEPSIDNPEEVVNYQSRATRLRTELLAVQSGLSSVSEEAEDLVTAARIAVTSATNALDDAERTRNEARAAVTRGSRNNQIDEYYNAIALYNSMEESLNRADSLYLNGVLANDRTIAEESGLNTRRYNLRTDMDREKGEIAVEVRRDAVEESETAYDEARYSEGLAVASQAQEFWKNTHSDDDGNPQEDPQLTWWIQNFNNALLALQQTVIESEDPLFAEMNQYLNLAARYYEAGLRISRDDPRSADAALSWGAADDLLTQVLDTFPGNEAALLLRQKIFRAKDPEEWAKDARGTMTAARRAVSTGNITALQEPDSTSGDENSGLYVKLLVLEQIDAGFSGLRDLIYDAEVALGIIIPETPEAIKNESRALVADARAIWENLGVDGSDEALRKLDQALTVWPQNDDASEFKDTILLSSNVIALPALPANLEVRLSRFDEFYAEQDYITAAAILDPIPTLFPDWINDPRVVERRNKVENR